MFETPSKPNSFDSINDQGLLHLNPGIPGILPESRTSENQPSLISGLDFREIKEVIKGYTATPIAEPSNPNFVIHTTSAASGKAGNKGVGDSLTGSAFSYENNSITTQAIAATAFLPDLIVQSNVSAPSSAAAASTIQLSYQIENQGNADAGYSYTKFYLSKDLYLGSEDTFLGYDYVDSIPYGYYSPESTTLTIDESVAAGSYYLMYEADGYGDVAESNGNNNVVAGVITITKPDLVITSITATSGTPGSNLSFSYTIKNQGSATASDHNTAFYLSTNTTLDSSDTYLGYDFVSSLSAGVSRTESASLALSSSLNGGTYYLFAAADDWNDVGESNENNNVVYKAITITPPAQPDLVITSITATSGTPGSNLNFSYTIKNQGSATASDHKTAFYLSTNTTLDSSDTYLGYDFVSSLSAGVSRTESASLALSSSLNGGTYYLFAAADDWDDVSESNENNNVVYKAITLTAPAQPDLVISTISATSATPGSYLDFSYTIKNQGKAGADYSYTAFYISTDATLDIYDTYLGYDYASSLSTGIFRTESASVYLSSSLTSGTYYIFAQADGWDYVSESNENNNLAYKAITIKQPDLIISSISATSGTPGSYLNFSYGIKNQGTGTAGSNYTAFYLSTDKTLDIYDTYIGYDSVSSLSTGVSRTESASVYLNSSLTSGTYYIFAQADGWDDVWESNENNNLVYKAITISSPKQDLVISSITATSGTPGSYLNFSYNIKNQGSATASDSYTGFYLSTNTTLDSSDIYLDYDHVSSLSAGASSTRSASVYIDSNLKSGTYYLFTAADDWNDVAESNENNNLAYKAITITGAAKPDLIINSISATSGTPGSNLNFSYNIKNQGSATANSHYTGFYLSTDTTLDSSDKYLGSDTVSSLSAGVSRTESASLALSSTLNSGTYYLLAKADGGNSILESDENNNVAYQTITIGSPSKQDLTIISVTATSGVAGSTLNFTYNIKNQGTVSTSNSSTRFYLSKDTTLDGSDTYLGFDAVSLLAAGVSSTESAAVALGSTLNSGTYYLFAKADGDNKISESNENNNLTYQTITIKGSDGLADWFSDNLKDAGLISLTRTLAGDGNLSRNDMIAVFRDAKDGAVIDANELIDLRTIVSNSTRFTMQDYVRVLSDYVVNANPANQWWTGGATTRTTLGNLYAGSSDTQMEKLIGKWFLGTDRPNPLSEGDSANQNGGTNTGDKTYRAVSGSLFQNGISVNDINQGALGTCYYLATLSSIAQEKASYIQDMFIDNGDNTYTVRFFNNGVANYVTVDKYLPTDYFGELTYASKGSYYNDSTNELWVALAEKAYAQLAESGWSRPDNVSNGYGSIEGGWMDYVIKQVTGLSSTSQNISTMTKTQLINLVNSNQILTAGFVNGANYGVYGGHAYSVTAYDATNGKFHLQNPWGVEHADVTWEQLVSLKAWIIWSNT
jgi:subtilase family serine protease